MTYSVSDANGNAAEPVTRMVSVVDTTKPVITMLGNATETVEARIPTRMWELVRAILWTVI